MQHIFHCVSLGPTDVPKQLIWRKECPTCQCRGTYTKCTKVCNHFKSSYIICTCCNKNANRTSYIHYPNSQFLLWIPYSVMMDVNSRWGIHIRLIPSFFWIRLWAGFLDWFDGTMFNFFSCYSSRSLLVLQQFLLNIFQYLPSTKPDTKNIQKPVNWHILASEWEQPLYQAPLSRSLITLSPEDATKSSVWNTAFCLEYQMVDKISVQKTVILSAIRTLLHWKNPKVCTASHTIINVSTGSQHNHSSSRNL